MNRLRNKPRLSKNAEELRLGGISLIKNAIKARQMCEPLLDLYYSGSADSSDVNWICYLTHQSIELGLKGLVSYYLEEYQHGHFLMLNIKTIEDLSLDHPELRELSDLLIDLRGSITVSMNIWQAVCRYRDVVVSKRQIQYAESISNELIEFFRRHKYTERIDN